METNYSEIRPDTLERIFTFLKGSSTSNQINILVDTNVCSAAKFITEHKGQIWNYIVSLNKVTPDNQILQVWPDSLMSVGKTTDLQTPTEMPIITLRVLSLEFDCQVDASLDSLMPLLQLVKVFQNAMTCVKQEYITEAANEAKMVRVDPTKSFTFPKEVVDKYGDYELVPELQVNLPKEKFEFSIDDIRFVSTILLVKNFLANGFEARERIFSTDYVALDGYCAMAIFENPTLLNLFKQKWFDQMGSIHSPFSLKDILFLGSMATDGNGQHVICFEYDNFTPGKQPEFLPFEAHDTCWSDEDSFTPVFKKEAAERLKQVAKFALQN